VRCVDDAVLLAELVPVDEAVDVAVEERDDVPLDERELVAVVDTVEVADPVALVDAVVVADDVALWVTVDDKVEVAVADSVLVCVVLGEVRSQLTNAPADTAANRSLIFPTVASQLDTIVIKPSRVHDSFASK
jgi:hypothetical protein